MKSVNDNRQYINYISFLLCFILCSNIIFAGDELVKNNKVSELEKLKIEVERLKAEKAKLELENNKLNNLLNHKKNTDDSKIKEQLEEKLSKLTEDNNRKEKEINQKEEELKKLNKEKAELNIKKTELKKDLEFRKKEVSKAENQLKTIEDDNNELNKKIDETNRKIKEIEDKHGIDSSDFDNGNKTYNSDFSNNQDFTYSSGGKFLSSEKYILFKIKANCMNSTSKIGIYKNGIRVTYYYFKELTPTNYGYEIKWNLKDGAGNYVENGTYEARIEEGNKIKATLKVAVMR